MTYPNKNTPECRYCIYSASSRTDYFTCQINAPTAGTSHVNWVATPIKVKVGAKDFCGKWRGVEKSYEDLFPKIKRNECPT